MRAAFYKFAKICFWALPGFLRNQLHDVRHTLVQWFRSRPRTAKIKTGDLDWPVFCDAILKKADYRARIIFEPSLDWDVLLFQRPHHMALALGLQGCLVIFKTTGDGLHGFRKIVENVWIASHPAVDCISDVVRVFYSTSLLADAKDLAAASNRGHVIYEYIDHIDASISGGGGGLERLLRLKKAAFEGGADIIVSSAVALHKEALIKCGERRCALIPNGVDVAHYQVGHIKNIALPDFYTEFRGKFSRVVGFFGAIAPWLWYEAIKDISTLLPDIGFVFIGPDYSGCVSKLPKNNNVIYLGAVNYTVLPCYADLFDVCFIPFKPGDVARATSPLKLYEYFALEKPVVVTSDMRECVVFSEVFSGSDVTELVDAINKAFQFCNDPEYQARLRALAENNDWKVRASMYMTRLEELNVKQ